MSNKPPKMLAMNVAKITFEHQTKVLARARKMAKTFTPEVVERSRATHVWRNRTQQAEIKLHGGISDGRKLGQRYINANEGFYIFTAHGAVEKRKNKRLKRYGLYLETMQGGRFAILSSLVFDVWDLYLSNLPLIDVREDYAESTTEFY
jgi:hypothetical protein